MVWEDIASVLAEEPPIVQAMVSVIKGSGAYRFQVRHIAEPDPPAWVVVVTHKVNSEGMPTNNPDDETIHLIEAAELLGVAIHKCVEKLLDGGTCMGCGSPTCVTLDGSMGALAGLIGACQVTWREDQLAFVRACDGKLIGVNDYATVEP